MKTRMNLNGTTRKAPVAAIAEITGEKAIYRAMPTCNYDIGEITVTKDGGIVLLDGLDIWQCNGKFKGERRCGTPHLTEEAGTVPSRHNTVALPLIRVG